MKVNKQIDPTASFTVSQTAFDAEPVKSDQTTSMIGMLQPDLDATSVDVRGHIDPGTSSVDSYYKPLYDGYLFSCLLNQPQREKLLFKVAF